MSNKDARQRLRHGRLTEEYAAPGFEAFTEVKPSPRPEPRLVVRQAATLRQSREQKRAAEREARAIEREQRTAVARATKPERNAARLRQRAERAEHSVERLRHEL